MAGERYNDLSDSLKTATYLIQTLMKDLKENEVTTATINTRLESIEEVVHCLNKVVREGNGTQSVLTKIALIESELQDIQERFEEGIRRGRNKKTTYNREKILNILKILPGIIALITVLVKLYVGG